MKKLIIPIVILLGVAVWGLWPEKKIVKPVGAPAITQQQLKELAKETPRFAEIDPVTGEVLQVIIIDQANINTGKWGDPKNWVQTSEKGTIRKNHASKGFVYDKTLDAFIPPKPSQAAILDPITAKWSDTTQVSTFISSTSTDI